MHQSLRIFKSNPGFAIMTIIMLALGIGACTAIFTVVDAILLKPLPYPEPQRLVQLQEISVRGTPMNVPEANYADWRESSHSFDGMAIFNGGIDAVQVGNETMRVRFSMVSSDFFDILKVKPLIGSGLLPEHFRSGATPAVVIGYGLWKRAFADGQSLENERIRYEDQSFAIAGVMPPDFNFPGGAEIWAPRNLFGEFNPSRSAHNWQVLARLRPGVDAAAASKDLGAIAKSIHANYHDVTAVDAAAVPLQEQLTQSINLALTILFAAVGILLLVACANVMNLTLTHIASRQREFAIRTAVGAGQAVLIRLFVSQSLLLAAIGGALGVAVSIAGVPALLTLSAGNLPRMAEIHTDWRVLLFAVMVSVTAGVVLGLVPALRMRRINLDEMLKQSGRSQTSGTAAKTMRSGLVVAQVAMTIVLLVSAALLGRSFIKILQVDLGFQTQSRIDIQTMLPSSNAPDARSRIVAASQQMLDRIRTTPGVVAAGLARNLPLSQSGGNGRFVIEGGTDSGAYWPQYNAATPGYFEALGIPLIRGRVFNAGDGSASTQVAVISQAVASHVWPGEDPIGKRINTGNMDGNEAFTTIVGIVGDVRYDPTQALQGSIYVDFLQRGASSEFDFVVRSTLDGESLGRTIAAQIRSIDPDASVRVQTLNQMFSSNLADRRFNLALLAVFSVTALLLALMGIYAVTSYSVAQRTTEIGIRMALGANQSSVMRLFLAEGSKLALAGIGLGIIGSVAVSRVLSSLLFNVQPTDIPTYAIAIVPMVLAALVANVLPALRAARIDPVITIQQK